MTVSLLTQRVIFDTSDISIAVGDPKNGMYSVILAMEALAKGQALEHDQRIAKGIENMPACDVIMLAQFSMAAAQTLAQTKTKTAVLTSPDCAVIALQHRMKNV